MATGRIVFAVVLAGIVGTIANSIVVAALTANEFLPLAISPGRNAVAIIVAALLPVVYLNLAGTTAAVVAIVALTVIPSLLAKLVFGVGAPWPWVFTFNAVYAIAAWAIYMAMARASSTAGAGRRS
jgi:hypothetical protein